MTVNVLGTLRNSKKINATFDKKANTAKIVIEYPFLFDFPCISGMFGRKKR